MFPKSFLEELRQRIPIVSYIHERVPLKKSGRQFKGLCPFHSEKTPSFMVNDERQMFHCFGCGEGGDIIHFVMKFDGLPFGEAVRELARRAGLQLPSEAIGQRDREVEKEQERRKKWALRANELARGYFCELLQDAERGGPGREYLKRRGLSPEISTQHFLGYADKEWESLVSFLTKKGVPLDLAGELGLIRARDGGGHFDFFRHRLIFPIHAVDGSVIGFGGRALEDGETAKYLNSPDSFLYHKSNSVYGLERAREAIRREDRVLVVEGYMDVLALRQAGFVHAVAPLGTALTEEHIRLLLRFTKDIVLIFDGDEAGGKAQARSLPLFLDMGMMPRVVVLPQGEDPDSFVKHQGAAVFSEHLLQARSLFEYVIDWTVAQTGFDAAGASEAMKQLLPWLRRISDRVERSIYSNYLARRSNVDMAVIERALGGKSAVLISPRDEMKVRGMAIVVPSAERVIIQAMLGAPDQVTRVFSHVEVEDFLDPWCRRIAGLLWQEWKAHGEVLAAKLLESIDDDLLRAELRSIVMHDGEEEQLSEVVDDCLWRMKRRSVEEKLMTVSGDIRRAEVEHDDVRLLKLLSLKRKLALELKRGSKNDQESI